jgi:FolB domain-containing protein
MDRVIIKDLLARGIIGINPEERIEPQRIIINLTVFTDMEAAGKSDDIADCVNYSHLARKVKQFAEQAKLFTVEALAVRIAALCLEDERVKGVRVRVEKPDIMDIVQSVGAEVERGITNLI